MLRTAILSLLLALTAPAAGWEVLFDGKSTEGWREITGDAFPTHSWKIEDGCLKTITSEEGRQDIRTVAEYRNFELEFEWKIAPGGNSGVKYLVRKVDRWNARGGKGYNARARGFEYQLVDDGANADAKMGPKNRAGALYNYVAPGTAAARPPGQFNRSRLVVKGGHIEHWLNDVKVVEVEAGSPELAGDADAVKSFELKTSPISLQNHNSEVWFRNIRIRRD